MAVYCVKCLQDHPHACGDKLTSWLYSFFVPGSSPRVWGQVRSIPRPKRIVRIIPTRVGTSQNNLEYHTNTQDHPHACGDKLIYGQRVYLGLGSSPRVWGQDKPYLRFYHHQRIIPTRVGTSIRRSGKNIINRDHPHACGDKTKEIKENSGFAKSTA